MKGAGSIVGLILLILTGSNLAVAQSPAPPNPESMTAARELLAASRMDTLVRSMLPSILQNLRPAFVQGRPKQFVDAFDAMTPVLVEAFGSRIGEMGDQVATVYAQTFSVDEMHQLTAFYRSPVGQKLLEKMPGIVQQTTAIGQAFGRKVAEEMRGKIADELRKRGLDPAARP
ncbi:MAG TPA: DUF2059 domain-containing protein [Xanthobacteraceae bacterium]|jgi:hypothetical protein